MNEIAKLLKRGESETLEFKKSTAQLDKTLKSISQKIRQRIKPEISPEIKVLEIKGKKVIEVKVKEGSNKPYYLDGIAYKRVGTENVVIAPEELERIILEKRKK
jgi:ATP-dependent DNA helicase RecG